MKKQKQRLVRYGIGIIVFCMVFVVATAAIKAANVSGWGWGNSDDGNVTGQGTVSSSVGWISMNSATPGAGGGQPYGVNIPVADGDLIGYAWSENLGWIAFDNSGGYLNGCPAGNGACSARRVGSNLQGWARFTSIADALAVGNSGGWQGWIKLNGAGYGIDFTKMDGTGNNKMYAWSDELGWIDFSRTILPPPPTLTLVATPGIINVDENPTWSTGTSITLTWSNIANATTCTKNWNGATIPIANGSETVMQTATTANYSITCDGPSGTKTVTAPVVTACYVKTCDNAKCVASTPMYLAASSATCTPSNVCAVDNDCKAREINTWKEVAP